MSFEDTTRKMADEVATEASAIACECKSMNGRPWSAGEGKVLSQIASLASVVEKLARCVARRFPQHEEGDLGHRDVKPSNVRSARADGSVCRDCGGMTVPTGACSTCSVCGSTGGCG
jgi:hypothetical protein